MREPRPAASITGRQSMMPTNFKILIRALHPKFLNGAQDLQHCALAAPEAGLFRDFS